MLRAKHDLILGLGDALDWRKRTFLEYQAMGRDTSLQVEENLEKEIRNISRILFSDEVDEKINFLIQYKMRFGDVSSYDVSICNFIRCIRNIDSNEFNKYDIRNKNSKKYILIKDDYEFVGYTKYTKDGIEDISERIIKLYRRYRDPKKPHESFKYLTNLAAYISDSVKIKDIIEKIEYDSEFRFYEIWKRYEKESEKIFKSKKQLHEAKIEYEKCIKKIAEKAESLMPFAMKCREYCKEKNSLFVHCRRLEEIERHLEIIEAVNSGKHVDHYMLEVGIDYKSAISTLKHFY